MNVAIGSAFRNSVGRGLVRYFEQVVALCVHAPHARFRLIAAEGDSTDGTRDQLGRLAESFNLPLTFVPCDHHGPVFGSTEAQDRMDALTVVGNAILGGVEPDDDVLLYVESDLLWDAATAWALVLAAGYRGDGFDAVAPLVMSAPGVFYDIYAYRKDGARFGPFPPYHPGLQVQGITEVDSVGSCLAIRGEVARAVRMPPGGVLVGWGAAARAAGYRIGVAAGLQVRHP